MSEYDVSQDNTNVDRGSDEAGGVNIDFAARVKRLPPYMFGRINRLLYEKRRAGADVIDLGMGNPSDPPEDVVVEKLAQAARDPRNHGYSDSRGILNLRREVTGNLKRLSAIRSYRGIRHQRGLPVRGQRTQTNARTRKGGRKTVGVVKKK